MSECPKCHGELEDDGTCSCGYGVRRKRGERSESLTGQVCAWNSHGSRCYHKGIMSGGTNGSGNWYCRQHWDDLQGIVPAVRGNALPPVVAKSVIDRGPVKARTEIKPVAEWLEGEEYKAFRARVQERVASGAREIGDDDEEVRWVDQA